MMSGSQKKGIAAVIRRELEAIKNRPIYWVMMLIIPLICFSFFTTLLHQGLPDRMPIAVVDNDHSSMSRLLIRQVDATPQTNVIERYNTFEEARYAMQQGKIYAFIVIPGNFQADVLTGKQPDVPFFVQNAYFIAGSLIMKDLSLTLASVSSGVNLKMRAAKGQSADYAMAQVQPIKPDVNEMGNAWVNYSVYLSTIMLPGLLQIMILIVTVFSIGSELKQKSSRQWLITADKSIAKALIGKMLPYTFVFIILCIFANVLMFKMLHFPFSGNYLQMGLGIVLFVLAQQAFGVLLIGLVPVLRDSLTLVAILGTLAITFCGVTFPIEGMLPGIQSWSAIFPLRHYFLIYVSQALTGGEMAASWSSYYALTSFLILPLLVSLRLKKALVRQNYPLD